MSTKLERGSEKRLIVSKKATSEGGEFWNLQRIGFLVLKHENYMIKHPSQKDALPLEENAHHFKICNTTYEFIALLRSYILKKILPILRKFSPMIRWKKFDHIRIYEPFVVSNELHQTACTMLRVIWIKERTKFAHRTHFSYTSVPWKKIKINGWDFWMLEREFKGPNNSTVLWAFLLTQQHFQPWNQDLNCAVNCSNIY